MGQTDRECSRTCLTLYSRRTTRTGALSSGNGSVLASCILLCVDYSLRPTSGRAAWASSRRTTTTGSQCRTGRTQRVGKRSEYLGTGTELRHLHRARAIGGRDHRGDLLVESLGDRAIRVEHRDLYDSNDTPEHLDDLNGFTRHAFYVSIGRPIVNGAGRSFRRSLPVLRSVVYSVICSGRRSAYLARQGTPTVLTCPSVRIHAVRYPPKHPPVSTPQNSPPMSSRTT